MLKLYGAYPSRSSIVKWYLEEIGVAYEQIAIDIKSQENLKADFLAINPMGRVPAIADGDFPLWESGAILLYLAEKHGKMPESLEERGQIYQWVLFGNTTLINAFIVEANREKEMPRVLNPLNEIFQRQTFLMGNEFNVADVAVGSILSYIPTMFKIDFSDYPGVMDYIKGLSTRPALQKAMGG